MSSSSTPSVIKFAFNDYDMRENAGKHTAKCKLCRASITEKIGTTSGFTRLVFLTLHGVLHDYYADSA